MHCVLPIMNNKPESHCLQLIMCPVYYILNIVFVIVMFILSLIDLILFSFYSMRYPIYTSSIWVGLSRLFICMITTTLSFWLIYGCLIYIPSPDIKCQCYCSYKLKAKDFISLLVTFFTLAVVGTLFLNSWRKEAIHKEKFLYNVKYSLPIFFVAQQKPNDPAGDVIEYVNLKGDQAIVIPQPCVVESGDMEMVNFENEAVPVPVNDDGDNSEETTCNQRLRLAIFGAWIFMFWIFIFEVLVILPWLNFYSWAQIWRVLCYIGAGVYYVGACCGLSLMFVDRESNK